jgi:hypothetical protein
MMQLFEDTYVRFIESKLAAAEAEIRQLKEDLTASIEGQRKAVDELIKLRNKL